MHGLIRSGRLLAAGVHPTIDEASKSFVLTAAGMPID
jgi:hypothetical protein